MPSRAYRQPQQKLTQQTTTPAPARGWNTRDPLPLMDPTYAVSIKNFIATAQGPTVRQGYVNSVTNCTGTVTTLMPYKGTSIGSDKLFAAAGTKIYDATSPTASPTAVQTGLNNGFWEYTNFVTNGTHNLVACNAFDAARFYDGTGWTNFSFNASPSVPGQITTSSIPSLSNWKHVVVHQLRLWVVPDAGAVAYYLPIRSMGGAMAAFDFGPQFTRGGTIASMATWSVDTGQGLTQSLVVVSTSGDVVIYQGTDPSQASTWALAGSWQLGAPIGNRSLYAWKSDLLYLSQDGLFELSKYLISSRIDATSALTATIAPTISSLVTLYGSLPGFQMLEYPGNNLLILNIPQINADENFQFVYNTQTNGWSQFVGWPAQCWAQLNGQLYFGVAGGVARAFVGYKDSANADGSGGNQYVASVQQAFNYFGAPGQTKQFTFVRPNLSTSVASPKIFVNVNVDFDLTLPTQTLSSPPASPNVWDTAIWDTSTWSMGGQNYNQWQTVTCPTGTCGSLTLAIAVNDYTLWASTDWELQLGGGVT